MAEKLYWMWALVYTNDMQWLSNRYVQLGLLGALIAVLIYAIIFIVFSLIGLGDFPQFLRITLSVLGAALIVYKFFEQRIS